jgi:magnesium transporter
VPLASADGFRQFLQAVLSVNATLVAQQQNEESRHLTEAALAQNEEVKMISAWAAARLSRDTREMRSIPAMNIAEITMPSGFSMTFSTSA